MADSNPRQRTWLRRGIWIGVGIFAFLVLLLTSSTQGLYRVDRRNENERGSGLSALTGSANASRAAFRLSPAEPQITRVATLSLVTREFDRAHMAVEDIVHRYGGYFTEFRTTYRSKSGRTLAANFRVPANRLDVALADLKTLGHTEEEALASEESHTESASVLAQLANARATRQRLEQIVRQHPGKVADFLQAEEQIAETRAEIRRLEAHQKMLEARIRYAMVQLTLNEEFGAQLEFHWTASLKQLRNAMIEGLQAAIASLIALATILLRYGPALLFWGLLLVWPVRQAWRRLRPAQASKL